MTRRTQKHFSLGFMLVGFVLSSADLWRFVTHRPSSHGGALMLGKYIFLAIGILASPMVGVHRRPVDQQ